MALDVEEHLKSCVFGYLVYEMIVRLGLGFVIFTANGVALLVRLAPRRQTWKSGRPRSPWPGRLFASPAAPAPP